MPALRRQGQEALCKSEARLGYKVSSRAARIVTQINPVWERKKKIFLCVCMSICHKCTSAQIGHKRTPDPWEPGLQVGVSHPMQTTGTTLELPGRTEVPDTCEQLSGPHIPFREAETRSQGCQ